MLTSVKTQEWAVQAQNLSGSDPTGLGPDKAFDWLITRIDVGLAERAESRLGRDSAISRDFRVCGVVIQQS